MRTRALIVGVIVLISILSPAGVRAFGVNDVLKLQKEQVSDSLIVLAIHQEAIPSITQDWLVRPIKRSDLLLAKVLPVVLVIHAPMVGLMR